MTIVTFGLIVGSLVFLAVLASRVQRRQLAKQNLPQFGISFDAEGFILTDLRPHPKDDIKMLWSEIGHIAAYKVDVWSYDIICLFISRTDETGFELDEEMTGWTPFCEALPQFLPDCTSHDEWFSVVAFPAFVANHTEIYSRAATAST